MPTSVSSLQTITRFKISGLAIASSLAGAAHRFVWDGRTVEVRIPHKPIAVLPKEPSQDDALLCFHREAATGKHCGYTVLWVNVIVQFEEPVDLPPTVLEHPDGRGVSDALRQKLEPLLRLGDKTASAAYSRWLRIIRWKSGLFQIGQALESAGKEGWTFLQDASSDTPFLPLSKVLSINLTRAVSVQEWHDAEKSLADAKSDSPVWFDFLFDGLHRIEVGDLHSGLISLATACEALIKATLKEWANRSDQGFEARGSRRWLDPAALRIS